MKKILGLVAGCAALLSVSTKLSAQSLYDVNTIQKIEITFTQPNWDYDMDTAKVGGDEYLMASQVKVNGVVFDSVGVKYKGNSSYDSTQIKNPLHISLNEYKSQKYQGYTDIKLSNGYGDPSMIREVLAYNILKNYMHCPLSNFAQVYINGNYIGLYSSSENIDKNFCADHFYSSQNTFFKCNPTVVPGPLTKSNFKFITSDSSQYATYYELKSKKGWNDLVALCDTITNISSSVESAMDMDRAIWMLAFNNTMINLDSYNGVFAQNHYLYRDNTGHYNPIIWDLNMCFGAFPFAGAGATSMGTLNIAGMQQFASNNHATDPNWPLINDVQNNATYKHKYIAHMRTMLNEFISNNDYVTLSTQLQTLTDTAVQSDNNKFFSYTQFQQALDSTVNVGSYNVPGIRQLMNARLTYLLSTAEFTAVHPTISSVASTPTNPVFGSTFNLTANVSNTNSVYCGYRFDYTQKFIKAPMFDDGAHNDGAAGDGVYGVSLIMQNGEMQYYIYAENTDAGMFAPERAEHEFYTLKSATQSPTIGQLVINELLADNVNNQKDEYNETEDWIELFNNSTDVIDLSNAYLSDNATNLLKWKIPGNAIINPSGYFTIWADDDASQFIYHANFSLDKAGGKIFLSNASSQIIDSISFPAQTTNVSYGRYPNGTGSFIPMNTTFGYVNNNYPLQVSSVSNEGYFIMYPNPTSSLLNLKFNGEQNISVTDIQGRMIYSTKASNEFRINTSSWTKGMYLVKCGKETKKLMIQ